MSVPPVEPLLRKTIPMPMPSIAAPMMQDMKALSLTTCGSPLCALMAGKSPGLFVAQ